MARGQKGTGKTEHLQAGMAVKLTPVQKANAEMAMLQLGAKCGANIGNQGFVLAAVTLAQNLIANGETDQLVEAYRKANAEQDTYVAEQVAEQAKALPEA